MYDKAYAFTAKWEGGLSNHPADSGGVTNYGVSLAFLKSFVKEEPEFLKSIGIALPVNSSSIRGLSKQQAKELFRREFWDKPGYSFLPEPVAICAFDCAVNSGNHRSVCCLQTACNILGERLAVDGILGPKTRAALTKLGASNPIMLGRKAIQARRQFLENLVKAKPSQTVFMRGWLNRLNDLETYITT